MKNGGIIALGIVLGLALGAEAQNVREDPLKSNDAKLADEKIGPQARLEAIERMLAAPRSEDEIAAILGGQAGGPFGGVFPAVVARSQLEEKAFEEYRGLLLDDPDALVQIPSSHLVSSRTSVSVRRFFQMRLASLPPSFLETYRRQVEAEAGRLLQEGRDRRQPEPLLRILRDYFCSRPAEDALDLLGDLAFEQGDFENALFWWQRLAPLPSEKGDGVFRHPGQQRDLPRVQAKQILALLFQGRIDQAEVERLHFAQVHPRASGSLAGKKGLYTSILQEWLKEKKGEAPVSDSDWSTAAGNNARSGHLPYAPAVSLWRDGPSSRVPLPLASPQGKVRNPLASAFLHQRFSSYQPVISQGQVILGDPQSITSFELKTGKVRFHFPLVLRAGELLDGLPEKLPFAQQPRFTLSVSGNRLFARMGRQTYGPRDLGEDGKKPPAAVPSLLVCLDPDSPNPAGKLLWQTTANSPDGEPAFFEGSPLVLGNRVLILVSELAGRMTRTHLVCFDLEGNRRWMRELSEGTEFAEGRSDRARPHLLTAAGNAAIALTHAGSVLAVDMQTGERLWGVRYPKSGSLTQRESIPRELLAPLAVEGRVIIAPADSLSLLCLDAVTGEVLWERENLEITQLIGVHQRRLIAGTRQGLAAFDFDRGDTLWQQPSAGKLPGLGRGVLVGPWILWPTQDRLIPWRALHSSDGLSFGDYGMLYEPTQLRFLPAGNVAFGEGTLAVATPEELVVYTGGQPGPLPVKNPISASNYRQILDPLPFAKTKALVAPGPVELVPKSMTWQAEGALFPLREGASGAIYSVTETEILCRQIQTGEVRWQRPLSGPVTWLAEREGLVLAAGPEGITAFRDHDGELRWTFPNPESMKGPMGTLGGFQFAGEYLACFYDHRFGFLLDPTDGKVIHAEWAPGGSLRTLEGGTWEPYVDLVPSGMGQKALFTPARCQPCEESRAVVDGFLRVRANNAGLVSLVDLRELKPRWTSKLSWSYSFAGRAPVLQSRGDFILAKCETNLGFALECLDKATGRKLWSDPPTLRDFAVSLEETRTILILQGRLLARDNATGRVLWKWELPVYIPDWQLQSTPLGLAIYPKATPFRPWLPTTMSLSAPFALYHSIQSPREFPVYLVRRDDGSVVWEGRFDYRGGPACVEAFAEGGLVVSAGGRIYGFGPN